MRFTHGAVLESLSTVGGSLLVAAPRGNESLLGKHVKKLIWSVLVGVLLSPGGSAWAQQFSFSALALSGQPAPGTEAGVNYLSFGAPKFNAAGQSTFLAEVTGAGVTFENAIGLWSRASGGVALVARAGNSAAGTTAGVNYSSFFSPTFNAAGQSAFLAFLTGSGVTSANDTGLWSGTPGSVALVAREGNPAPDTAAGVNYSFLTTPALNAAGQTAFFARVAGAGVTGANDGGIWLGTPGNVALLAREGDPAPNTEAGVNYSSFASFQPLNAAGQSVFRAGVAGTGVTGANDSGIWTGGASSLAGVVREGEAAPGAGAGTLFGDISATIDPIALNDRDEVVFLNLLTGAGVSDENDGSLWFSDATRTLSLIIREGAPLEVAPGDMRIVSLLLFIRGSSDEDGFGSGFNDLGQVAFRAYFTDGSQGIFIATPAALTEALNKSKTINRIGNTVTVSIESITGYTYRLQRSPSLGPLSAFTDVGSPQSGSTGSALIFTDSDATGNTLFYRVALGGP